MNKYYEAGREAVLDNIAQGKYHDAVDNEKYFDKRFNIVVPMGGSPEWTEYLHGKWETLHEEKLKVVGERFNSFMKEYKELLNRYPEVNIDVGCGCCGGAQITIGKCTYEFTREITKPVA